MNGRATVVSLGLAGILAAMLTGCSGGGGPAPAPGATVPAVGGAASIVGGSAGQGEAGSTSTGTGQTGDGSSGTSNSAAPRTKASGSDVITFPPGGAKSIVTWYHGRGGMEFTALTNTLAYASRLKAKGGATAYAGACGQIRSAALAAQAAPAMPLPSGAKPYSEALAGYVKTATACEQASSTRGTTEIRESVAQVEANSVALNRAAAVLIAALSET